MEKKTLRFVMLAKAVMIGLLFGVAENAFAYFYDFSAVCPTGQTLYYNIIDTENHYVELTCPWHLTDEHDPWDYHTQPFGELILPESVQNNNVTYTVTRIGSQAFYCCDSITSIVIPNTVTLIGSEAFWSCSGLTGDLVIPNSVTRINGYAFYYCNGLTGSLTISNSVTYIGSFAFCGCNHLTGCLFIPSSVTKIDGCAFSGCSGFSEIQYNATNCSDCNSNYPPFNVCSGTLIIGNNVERIPANLFMGCNLVGSLNIPNSVTSIGDGAFAGCSGFTGNLTIPNSVTMIGGAAFFGCSGFTGSLTIPDFVTSIGQSAFNNCSGFTGNLTIGNSVTTIGQYAFSGCSGFTGSLIIPNFVITIGYAAFGSCCGFTGSLTIPNSVTTIGQYAFSGCSGFTGNLTIPNSVTTINYGAFNGCSGFTSMVVLSEAPPTLSYSSFYNFPKSIPVYVPCGSLAAYQSAAYWNEFTNIQETCSQSQTVALTAGWNLFSPNIEITLDDLKSALVDAAPGTNLTIKSRTQNTAYNPGTNQWRGTLGSLDVTQMYMIQVASSAEITLQGMPINPAEHPVTISNGANWIAFPFSVSMSVSDAFAGFAMDGDVIKSRMNNANYNNGQWRGGLNTLVPGQGYIYISNSQEIRTIIFPISTR